MSLKRTPLDLYKKQYFSNQEEVEPLIMILSQKGILYCVNVETKKIKWRHNTNKDSFQAFQYPEVERFVSIQEDGEDFLYLCSSSQHKEPICWITDEDVASKIVNIFDEEPEIILGGNGKVFYLTDSGIQTEESDTNTFKITRKEFCFAIPKLWCVRFSNIQVYLPCAGENLTDSERRICTVHYARTPEKLIELFRDYGIYDLIDDGILAKTIERR